MRALFSAARRTTWGAIRLVCQALHECANYVVNTYNLHQLSPDPIADESSFRSTFVDKRQSARTLTYVRCSADQPTNWWDRIQRVKLVTTAASADQSERSSDRECNLMEFVPKSLTYEAQLLRRV